MLLHVIQQVEFKLASSRDCSMHFWLFQKYFSPCLATKCIKVCVQYFEDTWHKDGWVVEKIIKVPRQARWHILVEWADSSQLASVNIHSYFRKSEFRFADYLSISIDNNWNLTFLFWFWVYFNQWSYIQDKTYWPLLVFTYLLPNQIW